MYSDIELLLDKIDQESKEGKALGGGSLEGAEFTVRFYAGRYTQESLPEKPSKYGCYVPKRRMTSAEVKWEKSIRYPVMILLCRKWR